MTSIKVKDVFPMQDGIMSAISTAGDFGFNADMDMLLLSKCGQRCITPIVEMLLDSADRLTAAHIQRLAALIMIEHGESWNRIKDALTLEYNPLSASQYHEEETRDTEGETGDTTNEQQRTDISTVDTAPTNYISDGQNTVESTATGTNRQTVTRTLNRTHNGTSYKPVDLLKSEIDMRVNNRFVTQVMDDVKNYIAMMIY